MNFASARVWIWCQYRRIVCPQCQRTPIETNYQGLRILAIDGISIRKGRRYLAVAFAVAFGYLTGRVIRVGKDRKARILKLIHPKSINYSSAFFFPILSRQLRQTGLSSTQTPSGSLSGNFLLNLIIASLHTEQNATGFTQAPQDILRDLFSKATLFLFHIRWKLGTAHRF